LAEQLTLMLQMKPVLFLCLFMISLRCFSQDGIVSGIVFDKLTKERVATVNVKNLTTGKSIYNNLKGEFKVGAQKGDLLVFSKTDYHPDTIKIKNDTPTAVYMSRIAIQLRQVNIHDTLQNPEQRLAATKADYTKIYGSLSYDEFLTSPSSGGVGAGLSIDALWNSLSRSGRDASRLREIIEADYERNVVDYRFNRTYVGNITGLKDEQLTSFMFRYRPGFYTTKTASDYQFISMIRANLKRFLRNPRVYRQPPLLTK
jgi:hypothetical protein